MRCSMRGGGEIDEDLRAGKAHRPVGRVRILRDILGPGGGVVVVPVLEDLPADPVVALEVVGAGGVSREGDDQRAGGVDLPVPCRGRGEVVRQVRPQGCEPRGIAAFDEDEIDQPAAERVLREGAGEGRRRGQPLLRGRRPPRGARPGRRRRGSRGSVVQSRTWGGRCPSRAGCARTPRSHPTGS